MPERFFIGFQNREYDEGNRDRLPAFRKSPPQSTRKKAIVFVERRKRKTEAKMRAVMSAFFREEE